MLASTPNMKLCAKSLRRIKMHGDMNRQNRLIASLVVWPFVGAQSLNFWNRIQQPTMMMKRKQNLSLAAYISARETHLHRKKISPSLPIYASLTASCCLTLSRCSHIPSELWNKRDSPFCRFYSTEIASNLQQQPSLFLFFGPGWNSISITWDFFRFFSPFFEPIFCPGWKS